MIDSGKQTVILITFIIYLSLTLVFGIIARRHQAVKGADFAGDFFTGNKAMGGIVMGLMIMATLLSSGTFIGAVGAGYFYGYSYVISDASGYILFFVILCCLGKRLGMLGRRINATSVVQLVKSRYANNRFFVLSISFACVLFLGFYCASQLVGGAKMFSTMTGQPYMIGLILFSIIVMIYTLVGGLSSVASAAVFQGLVMLISAAGLFVCMYLKACDYGGFSAMYQTLIGTENEFLLTPKGEFSGRYMVSLAVLCCMCGFGLPHALQGTLSYKDTKAMKTTIVVSMIVSVLIYVCINLFAGVTAHILNPDFTSSDAAMPYLASELMPPWMAGILLSGAAAAIQSTLAGMLLVICSTIAKDVYRDIFRPEVTDKQLKRVTYIVVVIVVAFVVLLSINPPDLMQKIVYFALGGLGSSLGVPVFLGAYWKRGNEYGALASVWGGIMTYILAAYVVPQIKFGMEEFIPSVIVSIVLYVVVSLLTKPCPKGTIEVWFGEKYSKEYALRTDQIR